MTYLCYKKQGHLFFKHSQLFQAVFNTKFQRIFFAISEKFITQFTLMEPPAAFILVFQAVDLWRYRRSTPWKWKLWKWLVSEASAFVFSYIFRKMSWVSVKIYRFLSAPSSAYIGQFQFCHPFIQRSLSRHWSLLLWCHYLAHPSLNVFDNTRALFRLATIYEKVGDSPVLIDKRYGNY